MVKITDFMSEDLISLDLSSKTKKDTLKELVDLIGGSEYIDDKDKCYEAFVTREKLGSTGIGKSVAIPHAKTDIAKKLVIGFGVSKRGIAFESLDEEDAKIFFVFASPIAESETYLKVLARISRLIRNTVFREKLYDAKSPAEILLLIDEEENEG